MILEENYNAKQIIEVDLIGTLYQMSRYKSLEDIVEKTVNLIIKHRSAVIGLL